MALAHHVQPDLTPGAEARIQGRLFRAAGIISAAYIFSRIMGYLREAFLAARFGATHTTDAYLVAQDLPSSVFQAIGAGLIMVFIPVYQHVYQRRGPEEAARVFSVVLNSVLVAAVLVVGLGWVAAPSVMAAIVPGLPAWAQGLAVELTRIMMPSALFLGFVGVATAVLHAHHHFAAPAFTALISNLCVVGALLAVSQPGQVRWVAYAYLAGAALGAAVQVPPLLRAGVAYRARLDWFDPGLAQVGRLLLPVVLTIAVGQLQGFVDRYMASGLAEGSISALSYAQRVSSLPYGVVGVAVATVLYPGLAAHAAMGRVEELRRTLGDGLRVMAYILLPMSLGLFAFREQIVELFFQRGAFDPRATEVTALALRFLAPAVLFTGWLDFLNRAFFALQETRTPLWTALVMVVTNLVLNLLFVRAFGLGGLALGTSVSTALAAAVLVWRLRSRVGSIDGWGLVRFVLTGTLTSGVGAWLGVTVAGLVPGAGTAGLVLRLSLGLGTVLAVHAALGAALGLKEGYHLLGRLRRRPPVT